MLKQKKCDASLLQQQRLFRLLPHIRFIFVLKHLIVHTTPPVFICQVYWPHKLFSPFSISVKNFIQL